MFSRHAFSKVDQHEAYRACGNLSGYAGAGGMEETRTAAERRRRNRSLFRDGLIPVQSRHMPGELAHPLHATGGAILRGVR